MSARLHALLDEVERLATRGRERLRSHPDVSGDPLADSPDSLGAHRAPAERVPAGWHEPRPQGGGREDVARIPGGGSMEGIASAEDRLQELIDAMGHRSESMRATLEELGVILNDLERRFTAVTRRSVRSPRTPTGGTPPSLQGTRGNPAPGPPSRRFTRPSAATSDRSARLVAIEMAVGGSSRQAVANRLRGQFGIEDPDPVLDDVFGPGSGPNSRMPWASGRG